MKKIAVLASGRGSNFRILHRHLQEGDAPGKKSGKIVVLVSDRSGTGAAEFARDQHIPDHVIRPKDFAGSADFGEALLAVFQSCAVDFIVLAGYLKKIPVNVIDRYANRIINIHPALLPAFGGKGMYGMHVHRAVWQSGSQYSGVTVHLVNNEYDAGPIVMQQPVDIRHCDSPEAIAAAVLHHEHLVLPRAVQLIINSDYFVEGNHVKFVKTKEYER